MALPLNIASTIPVPSLFLDGDDRATNPLLDYEMAGLAIQNSIQGMHVQIWRLEYIGDSFILTPETTGDPVVLFSESGVTDIALAFDQNMLPVIAYISNGGMHLRFFDTNLPGYVTLILGEGRNPKLSLDDKRQTQIKNSDVILAYIRAGALCYRQQRERYQVERVLRDGLADDVNLVRIGMGKNLRMQFELA